MLILMNEEVAIITDLNFYHVHDIAVKQLGIKPYRLIDNEIVIGLDVYKPKNMHEIEYNGQKVYRAYEWFGDIKLEESSEADFKNTVERELREIEIRDQNWEIERRNLDIKLALKKPTDEFKDYVLNYLISDEESAQ